MNTSPSVPRAYARAKLRCSLTGGAVDLAALVGYLITGGSRAVANAMASWPRLVTVAGYVAILVVGVSLLGVPVGWWARRIEIRFGLNRQSVGSWLGDEAKGLALALGLGIGAAELLYALLRATPVHWWWWAWGAFTLLAVVMAQLGPAIFLPMFFKLRLMSVDDPGDAVVVSRLEATYARLRQANPKLPRLHGIFEWKLGEKSAKANAALTGIGPTRRVIISDTLLEGSPPEEIEAVFVHELGHHVHRDIWRGIVFQSGLTLLGFWLAQRVLLALSPRLGLSGVADVAGLPLIILVFSLLGLALLPASNGFVRAMERRADDYAFNQVGSAQPLMAGLRRLAAKNLAEVEPARWKEWLLYSHPSIATRLRRGEAWEAAHHRAPLSGG